MTQAFAGPDSLATRAAQAFTAYRSGDPGQMDELVDLLNPILWNIARAQGLPPPAAEDAVQTAWLRLVEHAERIDDPQTVMQWLLITTKREAWRVGRQGQRSPSAPDLGMDLQYGNPGPEGVAVLSERQRLLWGHLQTLPHKCRELLRVVAFADRPDYAQVSAALGMPVGSIGPTRGRCLAKLRSLLQSDPTWGGQL